MGGGVIIRILRYIKMVEEEAGITLKNLDEKNGGESCQIFTTATEIALAPISGPLPNKKRTVYYSKKERLEYYHRHANKKWGAP